MPLPRGALQRLLRLLEAPDCDCPLALSCPCGEACQGGASLACPHCRGECECAPLPAQQPCHHQLAADHQTPLAAWAALLLAAWPEEYATPPPPPAPALVLTRQARVEVYATRHAAGLGLFHEGDAWQMASIGEWKVGAESLRYCGCDEFREHGACSCVRPAGRLRNGATDPHERLTVRRTEGGAR